MHAASELLISSFAFYSVVVACAAAAALVKAGVRSSRVFLPLAVWMGLTGGLAGSGRLLAFETFPPPLLRLVMLGLLVTLVLVTSRAAASWLENWSLAGLVAFQAFRLPLELLMHRAATEQVMPPQMTYTGRNFDILTGILAIPVAMIIFKDMRLGRRLAWAWNVLGLALLVNVVTVAILSVPGPMRLFMEEPANEWVAHSPFIWLPTVLVPLALAGHVLVARKLLMDRVEREPA